MHRYLQSQGFRRSVGTAFNPLCPSLPRADSNTDVLFTMAVGEANDGQAAVDMNGLPMVDDGDLKLVTYGAILIKAAGSSTG